MRYVETPFEVLEGSSLEHSIVVSNGNPDLHVVGRWFVEEDGDFRGIFFSDIDQAEMACRALNHVLYDLGQGDIMPNVSAKELFARLERVSANPLRAYEQKI